MTVTNDAIDLKALLYALTQQREPLPEHIQSSLQEAGQSLQQNQPEAAHRLRDRIKSYPPLDTAYRSALQEFDRKYASQQRTKSLSATFSDSAGLDWFFINDVIPAADWVATAKHVLPKQQSKSREDELWEKVSRIAVMTIGGASLGAAIAQIPGGIIVGLLTVIFGWWYVNKPSQQSF